METLEQREEKLDAAFGAMLRDAVSPAPELPLDPGAYVGLRHMNGKPVQQMGRAARTVLNVLTLGAYGVVAQRRAIERFRANIRKL